MVEKIENLYEKNRKIYELLPVLLDEIQSRYVGMVMGRQVEKMETVIDENRKEYEQLREKVVLILDSIGRIDPELEG